jgi:hypothetical protein
MVYCDLNENIDEWGSEEIVIPYRSPIDNRIHRYFPDFYVKLKETTGKIFFILPVVKPKKQVKPPLKPKRQTKGYLREAYEYARNQAKWHAAVDYCKDRLYEFKVMTEDLYNNQLLHAISLGCEHIHMLHEGILLFVFLV